MSIGHSRSGLLCSQCPAGRNDWYPFLQPKKKRIVRSHTTAWVTDFNGWTLIPISQQWTTRTCTFATSRITLSWSYQPDHHYGALMWAVWTFESWVARFLHDNIWLYLTKIIQQNHFCLFHQIYTFKSLMKQFEDSDDIDTPLRNFFASKPKSFSIFSLVSCMLVDKRFVTLIFRLQNWLNADVLCKSSFDENIE